MKNRYFILSVLFWAVASVSMAITLPSTSYSGSGTYGENFGITDFSLGSGISYSGVSLSVSNTDEDGQACGDDVSLGNTTCEACCTDVVVEDYGSDWYMNDEGEAKYGDCMTTCEGWALNDEDTPAGEVFLLLPFALAYAYIKKRKNISNTLS